MHALTQMQGYRLEMHAVDFGLLVLLGGSGLCRKALPPLTSISLFWPEAHAAPYPFCGVCPGAGSSVQKDKRTKAPRTVLEHG